MYQDDNYAENTTVKSFFLTHANTILAILNGVAILLLIVAFSISSSKENNIPARIAMWTVGLILLSVTVLLSIGVQNMKPNLVLYYAHQILAVLTFIIMSIALGINNIVLNMCIQGDKHVFKISCGSHWLEFFAEIMVCVIMGVYYIGTQKRIVFFIDKGILDGIRGRSQSWMEHLK